jgi:hypothetical protein
MVNKIIKIHQDISSSMIYLSEFVDFEKAGSVYFVQGLASIDTGFSVSKNRHYVVAIDLTGSVINIEYVNTKINMQLYT